MLRRIFALTLPAVLGTSLVAAVAGGCSSQGNGFGSSESKICTPGQYGYCLCKNGQDGTRLCNDDGKSFQPCMMGGQEICPGGEVPLDDAGNPIPENDSGTPTSQGCPGRAVTVTAGQPLQLQGDTTNAQSQFGGEVGACDKGNNTPEDVYQITPSADGSLQVKMTPLGFDGVIYARTGACSNGAQASCGNSSNAAGVSETLKFNVIGGDKIWIFADGANGAKGPYSLDFTLTAGTFCGNGKIESGEGCDDKNKIAGDGCSPACKPEGNPPTAGVCPGMPVHVWTSAVAVAGQTTQGYAATYNRLAGACTSGGSTSTGLGSPDRVYAVTAHKTGTLTAATSNSNFDHQIYARSNCTDQNSELICASAVTGAGGETLQVSVTDGDTVYVIVDGLVTGSGSYDITFSIQ